MQYNLTNPIDILKNAKKLERKTHYPSNVYVKRITVVIEQDNADILHIIKPDGLSMQHMWAQGLNVNLDIAKRGGYIEKTILQAAPMGTFEGDIIGRYVFRIVRAKDNKRINAKIVKFTYRKQTL